jgi:ABC-type amino acid transport substrate-binding protein
MNRFSTLVCLFWMAALLTTVSHDVSAQGTGDSWSKVKSKGSGTLVCLWNESYGITQLDSKGVPDGVAIDILNEFTQYLKAKYNVEITLQYTEEKSFSTFLKKVSQTPNLLGVSGVSITEERKKTLKFTPYFLLNPNVLITHRDARPLAKLDDMATVYNGYRMKVVEGSVHANYAKKLKEAYYPDLVIEYASGSRIIFDEMKNNPKMLTIIDFGEYLGAFRNKKQLVRQNVDLGFTDKLAYVMHKDSDWITVWNEFLTDDFRKSTVYKKIIADNLGNTYLSLLEAQ